MTRYSQVVYPHVPVLQPAPPPPVPPFHLTRYQRLVKPTIDRLAAALLLLLASPLLLAITAALLATLGSPVLLRQQRVGQHGHTFTVYKFRTMLPDRRVAVLPYDGPDRRTSHKRDDDPRHTPIGRLLRKYSLDELPQLLNVLAGHMSLIGPRPELPAIVARYQPWQHARHAVKPGLTGLWQVTERGNGGLMHEHTDLDLRYAQHVTLRRDLAIAWLTIPTVLGRRCAGT